MLNKIKKNRKFAVNILAESQDELSKIFAGQIKDEKDVEFKLLQGVPYWMVQLLKLSVKLKIYM